MVEYRVQGGRESEILQPVRQVLRWAFPEPEDQCLSLVGTHRISLAQRVRSWVGLWGTVNGGEEALGNGKTPFPPRRSSKAATSASRENMVHLSRCG